MGLFQKLFGRGSARVDVREQDVVASLEQRDLTAASREGYDSDAARRSTEAAENLPQPPARPTPAELRDRLWHVTSGLEVKALVDDVNDEEATALVTSVDLNEIPLNAFCTDRFQFNGLDDRMVAVTFVALRLLEAGRREPLSPLLEKLATKFRRKFEHGKSPEGASHATADPWRIGESLMTQTHVLAIELLKRDGYEATAATLLEALLADYPDRLEASFWLAAARHNLYMKAKTWNAEPKRRALRAIDTFLSQAKDRSDYRGNVEALQNLRRENYEEETTTQASDDAASALPAGVPKASISRENQPAELTTGRSLSGQRQNVSNHASKAGRAGKCRSCEAVVELTDAKEVCLDWDGVDAYHFYCPRCYISTKDPHYYTGQLLGSSGKAVIDQHSWSYER